MEFWDMSLEFCVYKEKDGFKSEFLSLFWQGFKKKKRKIWWWFNEKMKLITKILNCLYTNFEQKNVLEFHEVWNILKISVPKNNSENCQKLKLHLRNLKIMENFSLKKI